MGVYESPSQKAASLNGLHLYQFGPSNCSQRVRLALEEKELAWTAHTLNAAKNEHLHPDYKAINPNRVVPTLINDGTVVIDSNDIISYLDEYFPEPSFQPTDEESRQDLDPLLAASSSFQMVIKTLSHGLLFRNIRKISADDFEYFNDIDLEPERVSFYRDYMADADAWTARMDEAQAHMHRSLSELESILAARAWLNGHTFGLADISWIANVYRLMMAKLPVSDYAHVETWANRIVARPAFDKAVASYKV